MLKIFALCFLAAAFIQCASSDDKFVPSDDLVSSGAKGKLSENEISPDSLVEWKKFFRSAPNEHDRSLLEKKLEESSANMSVNGLIKKGRAQMSLGQYRGAEATLREAIRHDDRNLEALMELSQIYIWRRDFERAMGILVNLKERILVEEKVKPELMFKYQYLHALAYIGKGDYEKGHQILSDLIEKDQEFSPGYVALASSYLSLGKTDIAYFIAQRGLDRNGPKPALYNIMGVVAEARGSSSDAERWYQKSLEEDPNYAPALVNRANVALFQVDYDRAEQDLKKVIQMNPENVDALISLAICYKRTGRFEQSKTLLTKAIDLDPTNPNARFNLAVLYIDDLNQSTRALRLFHEVLQISRSGAEIRDLAKNYINDLRLNREAY